MMAWKVQRARLMAWNEASHLEGWDRTQDSQRKESNTELKEDKEGLFEI